MSSRTTQEPTVVRADAEGEVVGARREQGQVTWGLRSVYREA